MQTFWRSLLAENAKYAVSLRGCMSITPGKLSRGLTGMVNLLSRRWYYHTGMFRYFFCCYKHVPVSLWLSSESLNFPIIKTIIIDENDMQLSVLKVALKNYWILYFLVMYNRYIRLSFMWSFATISCREFSSTWLDKILTLHYHELSY